MRKLIAGGIAALIVGLTLVWSHPSPAWLAQAPPASSYTGPGDVQATVWYYALRALTSATRGNKLVNVCTTISTVDTCADMFSDATTGALVITTIGGAACNTGTQPYNIKTWYELNGTGADQTQATVATRAVLSSCTGATTGANFAGSQVYATAGNFTQAQAFETVCAASRTGAFTTQQNCWENLAGSVQTGWFTSANQAYIFGAGGGGVVTITASDSACHTVESLYNGASSSIKVDNGTPTTADTSTSSVSAERFSLGGFWTSRNPTITFYEGGFVASSTPTSLFSNIHAYGNC